MKYHKLTGKIVEALRAGEMWYETFEHVPVRTSEEAAKVRTGYTLAQGAKAMIIRVKKSETDKRFVMLVISGDARFDNNKVKEVLGVKDIRLATEQEVSVVTDGVQIGGIPPLGNLFGIDVLADPKILLNEKIVFNAGDRGFSIAMKSSDYVKLVLPKIVSITG